MSAKYKSPSFLLPNELNTSANPANDTGINSLYSMDFGGAGSSQKIDVGILPMNGDAEYSISIWFYYFKPGGSVPAMQMFGNRDTSNSYKGVGFEFGNAVAGGGVPVSYFYFNSTAGSGAASITIPAGTFNANAWNHLCITKDLTTVNAYVNNQSPISVSSTKVFSSTASFKIGTDVNLYYNNKIDEVAIFNRALDSTEISSLWNNGSPSNLIASNLNPIAYYPLGEQAQNSGKLPDTTTNEWQFPNGVLQDYVMDFDGSNQYIKIGNFNEFSVASISFWAKTTATNYKAFLSFKSNYEILANGSGNFNIGNTNSFGTNWEIYRDGNLVRTQSQGGQNEFLSDGNWHHYVIRDLRIASSNNYTNVLLGTDQTEAFFYQGELSNFQIFNSALPATGSNSVQTLYNNGSPLTSMSGFTSLTNWWKLNADSVYTPSAPNYTTAVQFDATPSAGTAITWNSIDFSSSFTISGWFNAVDGSDRVIFIRNYSGTGFVIYVNTNYITVRLGANFGYLILAGGTGTTGTVNEGFNHVIFQRDYNSEFKVYLNGQPLTMTTPASGSLTQDMTGNLISGANNTSNKYTGQLSNAAIYNSFLSSSQVSTLFNFGTPETNISFTPNHWWKLNNVSNSSSSDGLFDNGSGSTNGTWNNTGSNVNTSVVAIPSWKIPSALPITTTPNYTTALDFVPNDYINCGNDSSLNIYNDITISAWIKADLFGAYNLIIGRSTNKDYDFGVYSTASGGAMRLHSGNGGQENVVSTGTFLKTGEWYHLAVTRTVSPNEATFFINGQQLNTASLTKTPIGSTDITRIGSRSGSFSFDGEISNVSIFNTDLTPSQISTLYNNGTPETAISFSPVSWWKLDTGGSTITDYGSGGNNGTNNGAAQVTSDVLAAQPVNGVSTTLPSTALQQSDLQFDSPYSNYSLSFDGATYVNCGDSDIFSFGDGTSDSPFSLSAWVYITGTTSQGIVTKYAASASLREWLFYTTGGKTRLLLYDGSTNTMATSATTLSINTWYHVVCTYDGRGGSTANQGINLYIDGTQESVTLAGGNYNYMTNTTQPVEIGRHSGSSYLNGNIDETAIFNTELTSAQVLEIYNNGRPKDLTTFSGTAPVSWWRLGENAYFQDSTLVLPNSITGAPNGEASTNNLEMISADAPGTYANGIGTNLDILDRVGDAALSTSNSQSYNMIPSDISPYVPQYVGNQIANNFSMTFDGVDDYINVGSPSILNFERTDAFSISAWVKRVGSGSYQSIVYKADNNSPYNGYTFYIGNNNKVGFNITIDYSANNYFGKVCTSVLNTDWNNVLITYNGNSNVSGLNIYINGSLQNVTTVGTSSDLTGTLSNSIPLNIGARNNTDVFFNGQIDEVAIFDTALNAGQIYNDIYQPTSTATNQTADLVNNPNLPTPVAWYRMGD